MATKKNEIQEDDVLTRAKKRFALASEADESIRSEAREDFKFRSGDQWPDDVKSARTTQKRPCLTINQLPMFLRQIINDQRQNRPSIKINAVSDDASVETAKVLEGLVRHIEYSSNAEIAYDTASDAQCTGGFGYFRIVTEYCDPLSFNQEIRIKRIKDPFAVRLDPSYQEPDGSDANWGFVFEDISKDTFRENYPDSEMSQMSDWESIGDSTPEWVTKDGCRICDYFERSYKKIKILLLNTGDVFTDETLPKELPEGVEIVDERESKKPIIKWFKINAVEVLEETDWLGSYIPIVPVLGDEIVIDGKRILEGVIRHAKDSQRMYNYMATASAEVIALAPKAPYIGAEGQFEGHESKWKNANTENYAYLEYKPTDLEGTPVGPPQRQQFEAPTQAITQERQLSAGDLRSTTGIMDAALGQRSNEQSGRAIERRSQQSQVSNFHFADNFTRSLRHAGRIILELIPKIYDAARTIRIIHEDGQQEMVAINQALGLDAQGKPTSHYFDVGEYDVTVSSGPSYQTKRQEAVSAILELTRSYPPVMQVAGDILVKNMDWPQAQDVADRLRKTLPPALQDNKDQPPIPPQVAQQMQAQQQLIQQLQGQFAAADQIVKNKMLETASRERIELAKIKADIEINLAKLGHQSAETMLDHQVRQIDRREEIVGADLPLSMTAINPTGGASPGISTGASSPGQNLGSNP